MQGAGQDAGVIGIFGRVGYMLEGFPKLKNALHGALSRCQTLEEQVGTLTESLATTSSNLATTQEALAATQGALRQAEEEVGVRVLLFCCCVFSNMFSNYLHKKIYKHIGCICLTFHR